MSSSRPSESAIITTLQQQGAALTLYASVLQTPAGQAFTELLTALQQADGPTSLRAYGTWLRAIAATHRSWLDEIIHRLLTADNPFTQAAQRCNWAQMPPALGQAARHDLQQLAAIAQCDPAALATWVQAIADFPQPLPIWTIPSAEGTGINADAATLGKTLRASADWGDRLPEIAHYHRTQGVGRFSQYHAFRWDGTDLLGIAHPDPIRLDQLVGYDQPQQALVRNTQMLLAGYPALHVLLYGSRGAGKSSRVKALVHEFGDRGLRLIEVAKSDLGALSQIVDRLRGLPQKFIIFVDDLSFEDDDDAFKALKVVLEGGIVARPPNVVVYATSNRRHLIREYFGDRPRPSDGDEIQAWDTVQEKLSFGDRFGLTLTFTPADQSTYLHIVHHLAAQAQLAIAAPELEFQALQWATRHNGRSGRTARQFIDYLQGEQGLQNP